MTPFLRPALAGALLAASLSASAGDPPASGMTFHDRLHSVERASEGQSAALDQMSSRLSATEEHGGRMDAALSDLRAENAALRELIADLTSRVQADVDRIDADIASIQNPYWKTGTAD